MFLPRRSQLVGSLLLKQQQQKTNEITNNHLDSFRRHLRRPILIANAPLPTSHHHHPQYGFVNYALELLVLKNFGLTIWEQIK